MTSTAFDPLNDELIIAKPRKEIVFIEDNVADYQAIAANAGAGRQVVILDSGKDGLQQIADAIKGMSGIDALHVVTHGAAGEIGLGTLTLDEASAEQHQDLLASIGASLSDGGDILFYGCNVGAGQGAGLVSQLAIATGADVAASNNATGDAGLGGDWDLEVRSGGIEAAGVADPALAAQYHALLNIPGPTTLTFDSAPASVGSGPNVDFAYTLQAGYSLKFDGQSDAVWSYGGGYGPNAYLSFSPSFNEDKITIGFTGGQVFTISSLKVNANASSDQMLTFTGLRANGTEVTHTDVLVPVGQTIADFVTRALSGFTNISTLVITPQPGNKIQYFQMDDLVLSNVQPVAPQVAFVTSSTANGTYKIGDQIDLQVNFDSAVDVTGTPQVTLETGATDRVVSYVSGSGSSTLTFRYTVQAGDASADLDFAGSAIALNGGTIKLHGGSTNAALTLPSPGSIGSLSLNKAIVIDGVAPTLSITSDKTVFKAGDTANITFTFSENPGSSFDNTDVSVTGGTLSTISGAGLTRTAVFTPTANVDSGAASISVGAGKYSDTVGNNNTAVSNGPAFTVDTLAPNAPSAPDLSAGSDSGSSNTDNLTNKTTGLVFTGTTEAGVTSVKLYDTDGVTEIAGTSSISGTTYTITTTGTLADGAHAVKVKAFDAAGNASAASGNLTLTIDTVAPTASITADRTSLKAGESANYTVTFSEDPGASFTLSDIDYSGGPPSAVSGSGLTRNVAYTPPANVNGDTASISVAAGRYSDAAGNLNTATSSSPSISYDTWVPNEPSTPDLGAGSDSGSSSTDNITNKTTGLVFTGTTEAGVTSVKLYDTDGVTEIAGTSSISGNTYTITTTGTLADGAHTITAKAFDAAGNASLAYGSLNITIDTTAPAAPSAPNLDAGSDSGSAHDDKLTAASNLTFSGTAEAGATVTLYDSNGTTQIGSGNADGAGNWVVTTVSPLSDGTHTITAKAVDAAGNAGSASASLAVTVDRTPPTVSISSSASTLKSGETATITFTFSDDPGSSFSWDGSAGSVTVSGGTLSAISGTGLTRTATFTPDADTNAGSAHISVATGVYQDQAGNNSVASNDLALGYDTLAPTAPSVPDLADGDDSGSAGTDNLTNDTTTSFSGTAENGTTVKLYDGATQLGSATASGGSWTIPVSGLGEGSHTLTAIATDAAGNASAASGATTVIVDTVKPTLAISSDASQLKIGETATITFTFSEDPGATFTWDGTAGDVTVSGGTLSAIQGTGLIRTATFTPSANTNGGTASISVNAGGFTDAAGNLNLASGTPSLHFDTLAPGAPSTPDLDAGSDTGSSNSDNFTADTTPTFSGTTEAGATVTLYDGATAIGSVVAAGGTWQITSDRALSAGSHGITASVVDAAGNAGAASPALTVQIITDAPTASVTSLTLSNDSGTAGDFITNTASQTISGLLGSVLAAGQRVQVSLDGGTVWNDAASSTGSDAWSIAATLAAGAHDIKVRVIDAVENTGPVHTQAYTLDSVKPAVSITASASQLKVGETATITFTFSEDPGSGFDDADIVVSGGTLSAIGGSGLVRTAVFTPAADTNGGSASIAVKADSYQDAAGNLGSAGAAPSLSFDTLAPVAPSTPDLHKDSDSGPSDSDNLTRDTGLVLTGTAEAGATVKLYGSDGSTEIGSGIAAGGVWTITTTALPDGSHAITAKAFDAAGNASAASGVITVTVDTAKPAALAAPTLAPASDSGTAGDGITKAAAPVFSGTAEALAEVTLYDGATAIGSIQAGADGAWQITASTLPDGVHAITARQVDRAGNQSDAGTVFNLTVDTAAPAAPAAPVLQAASDTGDKGDGITENNLPVIEGSALANSLVTLYDTVGDSKLKIGTALADGSGKWSIATILATGQHALSATQSDAAGNESAAGAAFGLAVVAPPLPVDLIDGMPVSIQPISLPGGVSGSAVSIPVVGAGRAESSGQAGVADIPLVTGQGGNLLLAQLSPGYGLSASGASVPVTNAGELLLASIRAATPTHAAADQGHLAGNGQSFLNGLASSGSLLVETIKPVSTGAPDGMLTLSGPAAGTAQSTALVIDAGGMSGGTIVLQQVDFAAVIGAAKVVAGSGMVLTGDAASQQFTVAAGGSGSVFAGGGNDTLGVATGAAPGAGLALLHGGTANDAATFAGARADYNIEFHNGYAIVSSKSAPEAKAMVVNVEQLQFSDVKVAVQNSADMDLLAGMYQTVLDRQADVMGIDYWANVHQAGAGWGAIALGMIASNERASGHEGFNGVAAHDIALLYTAIFNRDADAGGLAYWSDLMAHGTTLEQVASGFVQSVEMVGHQRAAADWDFIVG